MFSFISINISPSANLLMFELINFNFRFLQILTTSAEFTLSGGSGTQAVTPTNINVLRETTKNALGVTVGKSLSKNDILFPFIVSLVLSFTDYSLLRPGQTKFIFLDN